MDLPLEIRAQFASTSGKTIHLISGRSNASETIHEIAEELGVKVFHLVGSGIESGDTLFEAVSQAMSFPPYFGRNWDALEECMNDLEWILAPGYVILFEEPRHLFENSPEDLVLFLEIVIAVAKQWAQEKVPFHLALVDQEAVIDTEAFARMRNHIQLYS